jgi:hypothetical protein
VRYQKTGMSAPGIDAESAFAADSFHVILIENLEGQAKAGVEFVLPLEQHGRWTGDDDLARLLAQQQLPRDQSCFNGFPQTHVIGDEKIHPR